MMTGHRISISEDMIRPQLLQLREFRPFKTSDEYLWAMKEDLSDWLNILYPELQITPHTFIECLETGVTLCKHANNVRSACKEWMSQGRKLPKCWGKEWKLPAGDVIFNANARPETFFARDNVHNFITWCRKLGIFECLLFESDDLIMRKNEKNVILCLLEVARRGSHFGMASPLLVQFEKEIDKDIAKDTGQDLSSSGEEEESFQEYGPVPQIITNDLRSLDEMVRELVERCSCPTQFPMIRVAEGKYRIGNTKVMIYVRILRNHVMVRVGGGWDTLAHYLDKHDPCRCTSGHRVAISSKLIFKHDSSTPSPRMKVEYERRDLSFDSVAAHSVSSKKPTTPITDLSDSSSEISDEGYKTSDNIKILLGGTPDETSNTKGYQSRKPSSIVRARSLSTDEERPDSRSTDEEINHNPLKKDRTIMKSCSTGRVPRSFGIGGVIRSTSCERPRGDININLRRGRNTELEQKPRNGHGQTNQNARKHQPLWNSSTKSNSSLLGSNTKPPARSLSASGTTEFYGRSSSSYAKGSSRVNGGGNTASGKTTWNGSSLNCNGSLTNRPRVRPNLFHTNFFNTDEPIRTNSNESEISVSSTEEPNNLAEWIKKALEHESNEDKISHIELAIKQFENRQESPESNNPAHFINSLPYNSSDSKIILVRKRKENGSTKIPKPSFY